MYLEKFIAAQVWKENQKRMNDETKQAL